MKEGSQMNRRFITCLGFILLIGHMIIADELKEHEQWWTNNLSAYIGQFESWLGDENAASRICARAHIKDLGYKSILDIPCGLCAEYFGYEKENMEIQYLGMDITVQLVNRGRALGIPVLLGNIEKIPCDDSSFDVCYARHILEHLPSYETALNELIRVAKKEVLVTFFMIPTPESTLIEGAYLQGCLLYHNRYNKSCLEDFIKQNQKVRRIAWESVSNAESILHIYLGKNGC